MKPASIKKRLPETVERAVKGYAWRENYIGFSETRVFRLTAKKKAALYLKIDPHSSKFSLFEENRRLEWLKTRLPVPEALLFDEDESNSFVDLAEAAVADRYQDLALLSRSVRDNFGAEYESRVFEAYGIEPDHKKIRFYRLLDEFF